MNADQTTRCAALAKRIAELDPNWPKPGMACCDPTGGDLFRLLVEHADGCYWARSRGGAGGRTCAGIWRTDEVADRGCFGAIANGPDWRDDATLGALLLSLGDGCFVHQSCDGTWWHSMEPDENAFATRAEAILAAKVAQLEATNGDL